MVDRKLKVLIYLLQSAVLTFQEFILKEELISLQCVGNAKA